MAIRIKNIKVDGKVVRGQARKADVASDIRRLLKNEGITGVVQYSSYAYSDKWINLD